MKFSIYEIGPDKVGEALDDLAENLRLDEWTPRQAAAFVLTEVMANVTFMLYTTLPADVTYRYALAQAAHRSFDLALAETEHA